MKRHLLAPLAAAFLASAAAAQDAPYFQQGVDYRIEARLDEATHVLHGRARLRYTNRSRTPLDTIYVHQHLNAFRPNSAWARRELQSGNRRFQELGPDDYAYERFTSVSVDGRAVQAVYPGAPDSTVSAIALASPLAPGASATLVMDWDARLSTLARRQGRRDRHYDWAQWYPRVAVFDRRGWQQHALMPQGEFYGEFAAYDVTLDVAADQVIGATGVAVEGDPGWTVTDFEKAAYAPRAAESLALLSGDAGAGRKRVRFRAENVHHFAWSNDPGYRHDVVVRSQMNDAGESGGLPSIHVLYQPGDTAWGEGVASHRTYEALAWLQGVFGPYPWPQLTNLHRIESGGTEFPMMVMNGSNSESLIVHEVAHQYTHGALANNEWREGWLDEGFATFLTNWFYESRGQQDVWKQSMEALATMERANKAQPVGLEGAAFRDPRTYSIMTYTKGSVVLRMLRDLVGEDVFRRAMREYYAQHKLQHVTEDDLRRAVEHASGRDLGWFFAQWIDRDDKLDYGILRAESHRTRRGWETTVDVVRMGDAWMPVTLKVNDVTRTFTSRDRVQTVTVVTPDKPAGVEVDPRHLLLDFDPSNDRRAIP
ncbi:MAG TPA: M1 family metallopeptidase [Longimicrobiaceae bacterium]|jgi:hypothetical protein|nr:M1 family metallopeptidase [Longimicrobiaceae bacterium]